MEITNHNEMKLFYKLLVFLTLIMVTGCGRYLNETFMSSEHIQSYSWANKGPYIPCPIYCYKTLAGNECFSSPQLGRESRLIQYYNHTTYDRRCFREEDVMTLGQ